jgi:starch synthase
MYALRYGTIPIVTKTGGLKDTIVDIEEGGLGISHNYSTTYDVCHSINRALSFFQDKNRVKEVRVSGMLTNNSWEVQTQNYMDAYQSLT